MPIYLNGCFGWNFENTPENRKRRRSLRLVFLYIISLCALEVSNLCLSIFSTEVCGHYVNNEQRNIQKLEILLRMFILFMVAILKQNFSVYLGFVFSISGPYMYVSYSCSCSNQHSVYLEQPKEMFYLLYHWRFKHGYEISVVFYLDRKIDYDCSSIFNMIALTLISWNNHTDILA